jgi:hypothetical protein
MSGVSPALSASFADPMLGVTCYLLHPDHRSLATKRLPFPSEQFPNLRCRIKTVDRRTTRLVGEAMDRSGGILRMQMLAEFLDSERPGELRREQIRVVWQRSKFGRKMASTSVRWNGMTFEPSLFSRLLRFDLEARGAGTEVN